MTSIVGAIRLVDMRQNVGHTVQQFIDSCGQQISGDGQQGDNYQRACHCALKLRTSASAAHALSSMLVRSPKARPYVRAMPAVSQVASGMKMTMRVIFTVHPP